MGNTNVAQHLETQKISSQQIQDLTDGLGWSSDKTLARYFNTSRKTIWHWAKEGKLPKPHKIGMNTTRWSNSEVKESMLLNEARGGER
jgi:predicted DNA-binding transcriptional regulator AlpA